MTPDAPATPTPPAAHGVSLQRQLLLWLLLPQLVLWLMGGVLAWRIALQNGERGIDQSLTQTVKALSRQVKPIGDGLLIDFPKAAQALIEQDPADRIGYMVSSPPGSFLLGNTRLPAPPARLLPVETGETMLYDGQVDGRPVRVALLEVEYGSDEVVPRPRLRVQVAQSLAVRERIARELLENMLLPMGLMGLVLSALVYLGIARGLAPLQRLQAQIDRARADSGGGRELPATIAPEAAPQEVQSLAQTINRLLEAVARGQRKEKQFLNDAAHQLRTPLAGLIGQTELALSEVGAGPARERLHKVLAGAQRSAHLVHQLLQLARSESAGEMGAEAGGQLPLLDLAALARDAVRENAARALAAGVDLGWQGDAQVMVRGQGLLLREALANLVDNAILYAGRGAEVTVQVHRTADGQAELVVDDDGPGLPAAQMPHLFQRFWRGSELPGGCGLGLSIVQEVAQRHQGQAFALPREPRGLRVGLRLPAVPAPATGAAGQAMPADASR